MEETETKEIEQTSNQNSKKINYWVVSTIILAVLLILVVMTNGITGNIITGGVIGVDDIGQKVVAFAESRGIEAEVLEVNDNSGSLYEVVLSIDGQPVPVYITKDGEFMVASPISLDPSDAPPIQPEQTQKPQEIPKSDKPIVELFVMTHCPYGTQAEKGFIPTIEALGKSIDSSVKFVHYFLHAPEEAETPIQICIREEQPTKYNAYLKEFLKEGDTETALTTAKIDKTKLDACVTDKAEEYYSADSALSEAVGVRGSPTLVINGVIANSGRSSVAFLETICSAFTEESKPTVCDTAELSAENPSPGFGYSTTATASAPTNAQC